MAVCTLDCPSHSRPIRNNGICWLLYIQYCYRGQNAESELIVALYEWLLGKWILKAIFINVLHNANFKKVLLSKSIQLNVNSWL